jgi:hypothetical protein
MRKNLRDYPCVYCSDRPGATEDHVFARAFLPTDQRDNLPKVPACQPCNNEKSALESYLSTVLLFGSRTQNATAMLEGIGARRLDQNARLRRELSSGRDTVFALNPAGQAAEATVAVPLDGERLHAYVGFLTRGLCWHHWSVRLGAEYGIHVQSPGEAVEQLFARMMANRSAARAEGNFGNGILSYRGAQGVDYPELSLWCFTFYGGIVVSDGSGDPRGLSSAQYAITGRKALIEKYDQE